jgi:hypothetical protein
MVEDVGGCYKMKNIKTVHIVENVSSSDLLKSKEELAFMVASARVVIRDLKNTIAELDCNLITSLRKNERLIDSFKSLKKSFWNRLKFLFCIRGYL